MCSTKGLKKRKIVFLKKVHTLLDSKYTCSNNIPGPNNLPDSDTVTFSEDEDRFPELSNVQFDGRSSHIVISDCDGD